MIKALGLTIYTNYRDFICLNEDVQNLPHDVSDGSTAITRDTQQEFVYCKKRGQMERRETTNATIRVVGRILKFNGNQ